MTNERADIGSDRRTFIGSLAALGALGALPGAARVGAAQEDDSIDDYYQTLRQILTQFRGLPEGEFVYEPDEQVTIETFDNVGPGGSSSSTFTVDDVNVPFTQAERVEINEDPENNWTYSYQGIIPDGQFEAGDVLLGVAHVRSETSDAQIQAGFKYRYENSGGETAYGDENFVAEGALIEPTGSWERYYFPIEVGEKPEGSNHEPYMEFWTGFTQQNLDFGGLALIDYSATDVAVGDLPVGQHSHPIFDYDGRSEGATWREDAYARIEELRKASLDVSVVDADGNPLPGASVDVAMQDHEFDFGSAVSVEHITGDGDDDDVYRARFLENFNKAVVENGMKWPAWGGDWDIDKEATRQAVQWLNDKEIPTRGHYLVWEEYGGANGGGMDVSEGLSDSELQDEILSKIESHTAEFEGQVTDWDMHNHPMWQSNIRDRLGWDAALEWWSTAAEATDAGLYTNEMGNVAGDFLRDQHLEFVQRLVDEGAPVDGVGFMGHVQFSNGNVTPPKEVLSTFDQFGELDLPILITEFDIQIDSRDDQRQVDWQADYLRDFLIACFSHEAVEGLVNWGFWAGDHWRPTGALFDSNWGLRPHGEQFMNLVFDEWWTENSGETNDQGVYSSWAFKGEYEVTASYEGADASTTATLSDGGTTVELSLDAEQSTATAESGSDADADTETESTSAVGPGLGVGSAVAGAGALAGYKLTRDDDDEA